MTAPVWVRPSPCLAHGPGDAEVGHLDLAGVVDQDVARLHVAVDHAPAVGEVAGRWRRRRRWRRPGSGARAPWRMTPGERLAVDVLHDDEVRVLALAPVVDRHDVGVGEVGGGLGLPAEPLDEGRVEDSSGNSTLRATGRSSSRSWAR